MGTLSSTLKGYLEAWIGAGAPAGGSTAIDSVVELTPIELSSHNPATLYASAGGYRKVTGNKPSLPRVVLPSIRISIINDTLGAERPDGSIDLAQFRPGRLEVGGFSIINVDGELDSWATDYGWSDAEGILWVGRKEDDFTDWEEFFPFRVVGEPTWDLDALRFDVKAAIINLLQPAQTTLFAGTGDWEGSTDQGGKTKPETLGRCRNVLVTLTDYADQRYVGSGEGDIEDVEEAYTGGQIVSALVTEELADGGFTISGEPNFAITADLKGVKFDGGSYSEEQGAVLSYLGEREGYTSWLNATDAAAFADSIGVHIPYENPGTLLSVMEFAAQPLGVFFPDQDGSEYRLIAIGDPSGETPSETYSRAGGEIASFARLNTMPPAWRVAVGYQRNWHMLSQINATDAAEVERLSNEYRVATAEDASILDDYMGAVRLYVETAHYDATEAGTAATATLAAFGVKRDHLRIGLARKILSAWVGDFVSVTFPRYGYDAGKVVLVVAVEVDLAGRQFWIETWG